MALMIEAVEKQLAEDIEDAQYEIKMLNGFFNMQRMARVSYTMGLATEIIKAIRGW